MPTRRASAQGQAANRDETDLHDLSTNLRVLNPDVARPARAPSLPNLEREHGLRFIARTDGKRSMAQIAKALLTAHQLSFVVELLFDDEVPTSAAVERYVLLTLPRLSQRDIALNPFDLAELLRTTAGTGFISVEPDTPHSVFIGSPEERMEQTAWLCNVPNDNAPQDRYWHLRNVRVPQAWALAPVAGARFGAGILIGHPDTGWAVHTELDRTALDTARGWDYIDDDPDPRDPLGYGFHWPVTPGHGTATGSVIASRREQDPLPPANDPAALSGRLCGVAPAATLVPIRAMRFPAFVFDGDIARAIRRATSQGCHVISLSLGGIGTSSLEQAVNDAVEHDIIVCAAAGNCNVPVVAPALYPNCIGVAGSNQHDEPWKYSSRGSAVDISAPAEHVWAARRKRGDGSGAQSRVDVGQGTSFAVATVAGVAALWLAFHGRDQLLAKYQGRRYLQHVFLEIIKSTARQPAGWNARLLGPGIIDAEAVLNAPLPDALAGGVGLSVGNQRVQLQPTPYSELIAALFPDLDGRTVNRYLAAQFGGGRAAGRATSGTQPIAGIERWGPELLHILTEQRAAYLEFESAARQFSTRTSAALAMSTSATPTDAAAEVTRFASAGLRNTWQE